MVAAMRHGLSSERRGPVSIAPQGSASAEAAAAYCSTFSGWRDDAWSLFLLFTYSSSPRFFGLGRNYSCSCLRQTCLLICLPEKLRFVGRYLRGVGCEGSSNGRVPILLSCRGPRFRRPRSFVV
jgi:hypothetical protein